MKNRSFANLAWDSCYNLVTGRPTVGQLFEWSQNRVEVKVKNFSRPEWTQGWIANIAEKDRTYSGNVVEKQIHFYLIKPYSQVAINQIYLEDIESFSIYESIYIHDNKSEDGLHLQTGKKDFFVNRKLLAERLPYFKKGMNSAIQEMDLSHLLTEIELEILLKAINCEKINHLNTYEAIYLLSAATKISQKSLIDAAKNHFFETAAKENPAVFNAELKNIYPVAKEFLDNIQNELIAWSSKKNSLLAKFTATLDFDQLKESKSLTMCWRSFLKTRSTKYADKTGRLSPDVSDLTLNLLILCGFKIEKLSLNNYLFKLLIPLFNCLKGNLYIKSIELADADTPMPSTCDKWVSDALLDLARHIKSLENVELKNVKIEAEKWLAIETRLKLNKAFKYAGLFFMASQHDSGSTVYGFNRDCVNTIVKTGIRFDR